MDLLNSLINSDGHTCASQRSVNMLSSQGQRVNRAAGNMRSTEDSSALAVALASSPLYNSSPESPKNVHNTDSPGPPPSAQPIQKENEPPSGYGLRLQSIEDFDKERPYVPKVKQVISPPPKDTNGCLAQFHMLCKMHEILPDFQISEVPGGFCAKVAVGSITKQIDCPCPSKQAAKEAVCGLAIPHLTAILSKTGMKRKAESPVAQVDTSENWIGILQEYTQKEKMLGPQYDAMPTAAGHWACTCALVFNDSLPKVFGATEVGFPSKQGAKATAAKEAVLWLLEEHKLPPPGSKRQKTLDPSDLAAGRTGLSQAFGALVTEPTEKVTQRMNSLLQSLGLHAPVYDIRACIAQGYWDVAIIFDKRDTDNIPKLGGRIGEVKHVHGKAKAKEACSQKAVQLLEELELSRGL